MNETLQIEKKEMVEEDVLMVENNAKTEKTGEKGKSNSSKRKSEKKQDEKESHYYQHI